MHRYRRPNDEPPRTIEVVREKLDKYDALILSAGVLIAAMVVLAIFS